MREYYIEQTQRIAAPLEDVFAFFSEPANLGRLTPDWLRFKIRSGDVEMRPGAVIDYTIRLRGIPMKWRSEITLWEPPFRFVDEQRIGPYRYWIHEHRFEEADGETEVADHVRYSVLGGAFVQRLFVAGDLERIFSFRRQELKKIFNTSPKTMS